MSAATTGAAAAPQPSESEIPRRRLIVIFVGLILGILIAALDQTIVATALPHIAQDLHGIQEISWIITVYLLAQTITMPVYGKLGDIIGRKLAFQLAIVVFLAGSVLAGIAQSMEMLIAFRAVQGIGAGGLMIGAQTIMAEIVSARERGKYMSVMGPMIGVATVLGPLLGGYLTQHASWRWIFYINLPIGIAAIIVTGIVLKLPRSHRKPKIDYFGALTMAGAVACLVLILTWGGRRYDWTSWTIIGLAIGVVVLTPLWLLAERRAKEPILPPHLFRDEVFRVNVPLAFLIGIAMFGAVSYLPTYLQLSLGASATFSGVLMLPLMGGLMLSAVVTGQLISRTGRYKVFPIIGAALAAVGMYLLSLMDASTSRGESSVYMVVLGLGIGFIMPTLVLTVQNSVGKRDMGSATAGVNFFRQIGASFGTALIGSLFIGRLTSDLAQSLPAGALQHLGKGAAGITSSQLAQLPPDIAHDFVVAYASALTPLYVYLVPLLALGFVLAWFVKEKPLSVTLGRGPQARQQQHGAGTDAAPVREPGAAATPEPASNQGGRNGAPARVPVGGRAIDGPLAGRANGSHGAREAVPVHRLPAELVRAVNGLQARTGGAPQGGDETPAGNGGPAVTGRVHCGDHAAVPTTVTLLDLHGRQLDHTATEPDGSYLLPVPDAGTYLLAFVPADASRAPVAELVTTTGHTVVRNVTLAGGSAAGSATQPVPGTADPANGPGAGHR